MTKKCSTSDTLLFYHLLLKDSRLPTCLKSVFFSTVINFPFFFLPFLWSVLPRVLLSYLLLPSFLMKLDWFLWQIGSMRVRTSFHFSCPVWTVCSVTVLVVLTSANPAVMATGAPPSFSIIYHHTCVILAQHNVIAMVYTFIIHLLFFIWPLMCPIYYDK